MQRRLFKPLVLSASLMLITACGDAPEPRVAATVDVDNIARQYTQLVLALGEHDSNYVDAYYGPGQLRDEAVARGMSAADIAAEAKALLEKIDTQPLADSDMRKLRLHYLDKQLQALAFHAEHLSNGKKANFEAQAQALYDTTPPNYTLTDFDEVLAGIAELVPGEGNLTERVVAYRKNFVIPADKLDVVFQRAIEECKQRTQAHISLPEDEDFSLEYVQDKPWSGYNWYKGKAYSLIQINSERPIDISRAVDLGCHEGYPGHHTYNALLEHKLVDELGWQEFSVYPLYSPQSLIAEGSANYGIEMAFPGEQKMQFERDVLYPLAGLDPAKAAEYAAFLQLMNRLSYAGNEIARQYINGDIDGERAVALLQQYSLNSEAEARQRLRFFDTYGAYVINYNWGKQLVRDYVEQTDDQAERWARFTRLLSSPRVPSSIEW
ncbi:MAG: hypothetical protein CML20_01900 [Rheinheimera sp.]|uniref:hypothetical protein n=1 Tax=Arsukibacterium sp. UBA3155 TaxID=1946058 RepID=UPI000C9848DF|nr:hypothetical protein [Arsukibacterium sp. UBA3155]MAD73554.1 hypothetical protein [Rheinheimera sp.]|tara:strand:+ start:93328 stop:94638 length:1311 start_codon:yes stop_codon:yes gene_type:complete